MTDLTDLSEVAADALATPDLADTAGEVLFPQQLDAALETSAAELPELAPLDGPAFGSAEAEAMSEDFFDGMPVELKEGDAAMMDQAQLQALIERKAQQMAANELRKLNSPQNRAALEGWIGSLMKNHYMKLRQKAVDESGDIGLLSRAWNALSAEEQTEFLTKNNLGFVDFGLKMLKESGLGIPGFREAKAAIDWMERNISGRVPLIGKYLVGVRDWPAIKVSEMVAYGVLDCKAKPEVVQTVEGNLKSINKVSSWVLKAAGTYFGGPAGGTAAGAVGGISENAASKIGAIRQYLQTEIPAKQEKPTEVTAETREATSETVGIPPMTLPAEKRIMVSPTPGIMPTKPEATEPPHWMVMDETPRQLNPITGKMETPPQPEAGTI